MTNVVVLNEEECGRLWEVLKESERAAALYDREESALKRPSIKDDKKLPVVLSRQELKRLFVAPHRQKQRVMFCLIYSAGLRVSELCNLKISDVDFDRNQIRTRQSKGNKDR